MAVSTPPKLLAFSALDEVTLSATSEAAGHPVENVQIGQPAWKWQSTGLSPQTIQQTTPFLYQRSFSGFCLYNHNLSASAEVTIQLASDPGFTDIVFEAFIGGRSPLYGLGECPLGLVGLGGYDDEGFVFPFTVYWHTLASADYARIIINDPYNPDGYVEVGRIMWGQEWFSEIGMDWGRVGGFEDDTQLTRTRGGALRGSPRIPYRSASVQFSWLTDSEAFSLSQIFEARGKRKDVLLSVYPDDGTSRERLFTMLGRLTEWGNPQQLETRYSRASITVEELR